MITDHTYARKVANQFAGALIGATLFVMVLAAATTQWGIHAPGPL